MPEDLSDASSKRDASISIGSEAVEARCASCRYFKPLAPSKVRSFGKCVRHPPTLVVTRPVVSPRSLWPQVNRDDWCGEWQVAEQRP